MADLHIERIAAVLVDYSVSVRQGDLVQIAGGPIAEPLIKEIYRLTLARGAHPYVRILLPGLQELLLEHADTSQLEHVSLLDTLFVERFDARILIESETNTKRFSQSDPSKQVIHQAAGRELKETGLLRIASGACRVCWTIFPTPAYAQDAEMSLRGFEEMLSKACFVDQEDPIAAWREEERSQAQVVQYLAGKRELRLVAPDTDLRVSIEGRAFRACAGTQNFPDGEIYSCPIEDSAGGHVFFPFPVREEGREMRGIRLWFEGGRVVRESAEQNESYLTRVLDTDAGSRVLGEFAFGTNRGVQRPTGNMMLDEKMAGTVHLALGHGYAEAGGVNQSSVHWDLVCDLRQDSAVYADGQMFYKNGRFLIGS